MARVTLGLGMSHSSQLSLTPEWWGALAEVDKKRTPYEELLGNAPDWLKDVVNEEKWAGQHENIQKGVAETRKTLLDNAPDVVVVIGDDQKELFLEDMIPEFAVFWGEKIWDIPQPLENLAPAHQAASWGMHAEEPEAYVVASDLSKHIIDQLVGEGFDIAQFTRQTAGRTVGHSWTVTRRRLMNEHQIPMVPFMVNTYYPPNQPRPERCYALGQALRRAIESWGSEQTVCLIASGGLSHFVVDEDLDRDVISALERKDKESLTSIPMEKLQSGNSEILNWIILAGALADADMELIDYIPVYRSLAGTGCGFIFARWLYE